MNATDRLVLMVLEAQGRELRRLRKRVRRLERRSDRQADALSEAVSDLTRNEGNLLMNQAEIQALLDGVASDQLATATSLRDADQRIDAEIQTLRDQIAQGVTPDLTGLDAARAALTDAAAGIEATANQIPTSGSVTPTPPVVIDPPLDQPGAPGTADQGDGQIPADGGLPTPTDPAVPLPGDPEPQPPAEPDVPGDVLTPTPAAEPVDVLPATDPGTGEPGTEVPGDTLPAPETPDAGTPEAPVIDGQADTPAPDGTEAPAPDAGGEAPPA